MRQNFKFHAIAVASICAIITVVYLLTPEQKPPEAAKPQNGRAVQIYSATWGENCNTYIDQALIDQQSAPPAKDADGHPIPPLKLERATPNNVLSALSSICNGQPSCEITPSSEKFGVEPMQTCFKSLEVSYRCFDFDRLWTVSIDQNATTTLDCTTHDPATPETTAPASQ